MFYGLETDNRAPIAVLLDCDNAFIFAISINDSSHIQ